MRKAIFSAFLAFSVLAQSVLFTGIASAEDYWVYTDTLGIRHYVRSEESDFSPGLGTKYATVISVNSEKGWETSNRITYGYDEGYWWCSVEGNHGTKSSRVTKGSLAQAVLDFGLAHWTRNGFVE